jgi:hypothetical protein
MSRNFYCLKVIGKGRINRMEVIITPDLYPMTNNREERNEIRSLLTELKEEHIVPINMSTGEFTIECLSRGLNDFRKDLVVYDC